MILARCPACQTVFRVRPEQLRTHKGAVRCGHCYSPFNALDHLVEDERPAATASDSAEAPAHPEAPPATAKAAEPAGAGKPETARPSPARTPGEEPRGFAAPGEPQRPGGRADSLFVLEERNESGARLEDKDRELPFDSNDLAFPPGLGLELPPEERSPAPRKGSTFDDLAAQLEFGLPDSFLTAPMRRAAPPAGPAAPKTEPLAREPEHVAPISDSFARKTEPSPLEGEPLAGMPDAAAPKSEQNASSAAPHDFVELPDLPAADLEPTIQPLHETGRFRDNAFEAPTELGLAAAPSAAQETEDPQAPFIPDEPPPIEHLDAVYGRRQPATPGRRWAWGLGIGILLGLLAAQLAFVFRDDIARQWPQLRPAFEAACAELGCTMRLPRIAGAISIESSDLQSDPVEPGRFLLNAVVRNRASHVQALPHLELTLTDARDRPLVRRVFAPEEWVVEGDPTRGFLPGADMATRIAFTAPGVEAAGYRVYVFYP